MLGENNKVACSNCMPSKMALDVHWSSWSCKEISVTPPQKTNKQIVRFINQTEVPVVKEHLMFLGEQI